MSSRMFLVILCLCITYTNVHSQCGGGELYFRIKPWSSNSPYTFDLNITMNGYGWSWDTEVQKPIPQTSFIRSIQNTRCISYSAPKTSSSPNENIPWGIFIVVMSCKNQNNQVIFTRTFTLDLRDQNWSFSNSPNYPGADTFIEYDINNNKITLSADPNRWDYTDNVNNNSNFNIWSIWGIAAPLQSNFKIPVTLQNRIEGTTFDFGYLKAGTNTINSGNNAEFKDVVQNTIEHGTTETYYNNKREFSFKWTKSNSVTSLPVENIYNYQYIFSIGSNVQQRIITRNFKSVYPLTIKAILGEAGNNYNSKIVFKDPTKTNTLDEVIINQDGYVNNEAFKQLSEDIGDLKDQKYSVQAVSTIPYGGKNYYWYSGDYNPSTSTDLLLTGPTSLNAYYKGHMLSNSSSAFSGSGQRKVVRDEVGRLNMVYESMGFVWLTISSDNGVNWSPEIKINYVEPAFNIPGSATKCPSIVQSDDNTGKVYIAYQFNYGDNSSGIAVSAYFNGQHRWTALVDDSNISYSYNCNPVIAVRNDILNVVYRKTASNGLYCTTISVDGLGNPVVSSPVTVPATTTSSSNPSITSGVNSQGYYKFYMVYQEGDASIKYFEWSISSNPSGIPADLSSGTGVAYHFTPFIAQSSGNPVVSWNYSGGYGSFGMVRRKIGSTWSSPYMIGTLMSSGITNTAFNSGNEGIFAWKGSTPQFIKLTNGNYGPVTSLSGAGEIKLSNGSDFANIKAITFNTTTSPYSLVPLSYNFNTLSKSSGNDSISYGRLAVISAGGAEFSYYLGDISVDGEQVQFKQTDPFARLETSSEQSDVLISNNFTLTDKSKFSFTSYFNSIKTENAKSGLSEDSYIRFRVELFPVEEGKTLVSFNEAVYTVKNLNDSGKAAYSVDCNGIKPGIYYLKVITETNTEADYYFADVQSEINNELAKENQLIETKINSTVIKDYALERNYPNPFNPSTTITYQLPKEGMVTLKIYDAIGTEVTTLVNEYKPTGRYNVTFNASNLASGVYFYRLQVNDFISSKKLILMK